MVHRDWDFISWSSCPDIASAITGSGIQTALSRLIASRLALGKRSEAQNCFLLGTASAFLLSAAVSALIYRNSLFVASELLKTPETAALIRILALSFPLNTVHTCINSYYFAKKNTVIPSGLQLLEQIVRVGSSCLIYLILVSKNVEVTAVIAAAARWQAKLPSLSPVCSSSELFLRKAAFL